MKGHIDEANVILTNRKFKGFKYEEESLKDTPDLLGFNTEFKIPALEFFRVIEYLDKNKIASVELEFDSEFQKLVITEGNSLIEVEIKIKVISSNNVNSISRYSVEYLKAFLKEYSVKDLRGAEIKINMADEHPLKIELMGDYMILAPKVEVD